MSMVRGSRSTYSRGGRGGGSGSSYRGSSNSSYRGYSGRYNSGGYGTSNSQYSNSSGSGGRYSSSGGGSSGGGGGNSSSYNNSYKYSVSKYQSSSSDRYGGNTRNDTYKRSYRQSSRDESPNRKRSRTEGSRRSHDYNSSSDYSTNRYDNNSGSYNRRIDNTRHGNSPATSSSSRTMYRSNRDSSTSSNRSRERMGPPKGLPPRRFRGSYSSSTIGGGSNSGGGGGGGGSGGGGSLTSSSYRGSLRGSYNTYNTYNTYNRGGSTLRRPHVLLRSIDLRLKRRFISLKARDSLRRLKIARIRRTERDDEYDDRKSKESSTKKSSKSISTTAAANIDENGADTGKMDTSEKNESGEISSKKSSSSKTAIKSISSSTPSASTTKEVGGSSAADDELTDNMDKSGKKIGSGIGSDNEKNDSKKRNGPDDQSPQRHRTTTKFIKLTCVHCRMKCLTFKDYTNHLYSRSHKTALGRLALRQKAQLARMRLQQRNAQREIEDNVKGTNDEDDDVNFCLMCRLNYRSSKSDHQASDAHRNMQKFLMPYCTVCRISFKSPMIYETHRSSLDHIKRKARKDLSNDNSEEDEREVDLEQFMTVDSIGDVDGQIGGENDDLKKDNIDDLLNSKTLSDVNVGNEHVKKVEIYYCELCHYYLPYKEEQETELKKHCGTRSHLRAYLRFKENQSLRAAAEKIHRRHHELRDSTTTKKDKEGSIKNNNEAKPDLDVAKEKNGEDDIDIDKELLQTETVDKLISNDDEEEDEEDEEEDSTTTTERYDRFKNSEKINKEKELLTTKTTEGEDENVIIEIVDDDAVGLKPEDDHNNTLSDKTS